MVLSLASTAFGAVVIDFDDIDDTGNSGYSVVNDVVSTSSDDVTVKGDGTAYALKLEGTDVALIIDGDVVVGLGILANGDLTVIAGTDGGNLNVYGPDSDELVLNQYAPVALEVKGSLTLDGGVVINAETKPNTAAEAVIAADDINIIDAKLTATARNGTGGYVSAIHFGGSLTIGDLTFESKEDFDAAYPSNNGYEGARASVTLSTLTVTEFEQVMMDLLGTSISGVKISTFLTRLYMMVGGTYSPTAAIKWAEENGLVSADKYWFTDYDGPFTIGALYDILETFMDLMGVIESDKKIVFGLLESIATYSLTLFMNSYEGDLPAIVGALVLMVMPVSHYDMMQVLTLLEDIIAKA